jgi:hypothetical protein
MLAFRSVVSVLLRVLGDFSLHPQDRPCGRPPAALRPGSDTTVTGEPASPSRQGGQSSPESCPLVRAWSALGPRSIGTRWSSTGTNGQPRYDESARQAPMDASTSQVQESRRRVQVPPPTPPTSPLTCGFSNGEGLVGSSNGRLEVDGYELQGRPCGRPLRAAALAPAVASRSPGAAEFEALVSPTGRMAVVYR